MSDNVFISWMGGGTNRLFLGGALFPLTWSGGAEGGGAVAGRGVAGEVLNNDFIRPVVVVTGAAGF